MVSIHKNQPKSTSEETYSKNDIIYKAVGLRLLNLSYKEIAFNVKRKEQTVRSWFSTNGACKSLYEEKKKLRQEELREHISEVNTLLDETLLNALLILRERILTARDVKLALRLVEANGLLQRHHFDQEIKSQGILEHLKDISIRLQSRNN